MNYTHPIAIVPGKSLEFFDGIGIWFFVLAILFVLVLLVTLVVVVSRVVISLVRYIATTVRLISLGLVAPTFVFLSSLYSLVSGRLASILSLLSYLSRPSALVDLSWSFLRLFLTSVLFRGRRLLVRLRARLVAFCIRHLLAWLASLDCKVTSAACENDQLQEVDAAATVKNKVICEGEASDRTIYEVDATLVTKDKDGASLSSDIEASFSTGSTSTLTNASASSAASENTLADLNAFWSTTRSTVRTQKAAVARQEEALTRKDEDAARAAQRIAELEAELANARMRLAASEQAREQDRDREAQLKADNDKLKRSKRALCAKLAEHEGLLTQAGDAVSAYVTRLDAAHSEVAQLKDRAQQDKAVKKSQNKELEDLTRDNVDLQAKHAQLAREFAGFKEQAAVDADIRARLVVQQYEAANARALEGHKAELKERDQENANLRTQLGLVNVNLRTQLALVNANLRTPTTYIIGQLGTETLSSVTPRPAQPSLSPEASSPSPTKPSTPSKPSTSARLSPSLSASSPASDQCSTDTIRPCVIPAITSLKIRDDLAEMGDPCSLSSNKTIPGHVVGMSSSCTSSPLSAEQECAQETQSVEPAEESVVIADQLAKFKDFSDLLGGDISLGDTRPDLSFPDREEKHKEEHQSLVSSSSSSAHCSTSTVRPRCPTPAEDSSFTIQDKLRDVSIDLLHGDISLGAAQFDNSLSEEDEQENAKVKERPSFEIPVCNQSQLLQHGSSFILKDLDSFYHKESPRKSAPAAKCEEPAQSPSVRRIDDNAPNLLDGDDSVIRAQGSSWSGNGSNSLITAIPNPEKASSPGKSKTKGKGKGKESSRSGTLESDNSFPADLSAEFSQFSESVGNASTPAKRSRRRAKGRSPESPGIPSPSTADSLASSSPKDRRRSRVFLTPSTTSARLADSATEPATPSPSPGSSKRTRGGKRKAGGPLEPLALNVPRK